MANQQDADPLETWNSPLRWGVAAAASAVAALMLAFASPLLFAAGVATLTVAAVSQASRRHAAEMSDHRSESWEATAAKIAACMECVDRVPADTQGRFQTMVAAQEHTTIHRIH